MTICFITGPEGSGTTALLRALTNHPCAVKGDASRFGETILHGAAGAQLLPIMQMSSAEPGRYTMPHATQGRRSLERNAAALLTAQPGTRAIFFKYSTPALRPRRWPIFQPLFETPDFRVITISRRPVDAIYSAFRRFSQHDGGGAGALVAAYRSHAQGGRHIRAQLAKSPRERCFHVQYEELARDPESTLRSLCGFVGLDYLPVDTLLPGRGFSNQNGKWKKALFTPRSREP
jgi:hypothetical protein